MLNNNIPLFVHHRNLHTIKLESLHSIDRQKSPGIVNKAFHTAANQYGFFNLLPSSIPRAGKTPLVVEPYPYFGNTSKCHQQKTKNPSKTLRKYLIITFHLLTYWTTKSEQLQHQSPKIIAIFATVILLQNNDNIIIIELHGW